MDLLRSRLTRCAMPAQLVVLLLGFTAAAWGGATFPVSWQQSRIERTAIDVIDRHVFRREALVSLTPDVEALERVDYCRPEVSWSATIERPRLAEDARAAGAERTSARAERHEGIVIQRPSPIFDSLVAPHAAGRFRHEPTEVGC
jgi:hypothetical protein